MDMNQSGAEQYLVCQPAAENIIVLFNPLMKFVIEIDEALDLRESAHCGLYSYLTSWAKDFLNEMNVDADNIQGFDEKMLDIPK